MRLLLLDKGAQRVVRPNESGKSDELWHGKGSALHDDEPDIPVYVRLAPTNNLGAELISAVLAAARGLPVPEPFLVVIQPDDLPDSRFVDDQQPVTLAFASRDIGGDTFAQLMNTNSASAQAMLKRWDQLVAVSTFDEWIANVDRNHGNLISVRDRIWLIDHAEALGGSLRKMWDLADFVADKVSNRLADVYLTGDGITERRNHLDRAEDWVAETVGLDLSDAIRCANLGTLHSDDEQSALLEFLSRRLYLTHHLLCSRLGLQQLNLHAPPPSASASPESGLSSSSPQS